MSADLQRLLAELSPEERQALILAARHQCWRDGDLTYKLHEGQKAVHAAMVARGASREVLEIARRWGKTFLLVVRAAEVCQQNPGKRVVYGAPTLKHLEEFIIPTLELVAEDAPDDCRPIYEPSSGHWTFPNGAYVHLFGADDKRKADRGRGSEAILAMFDEAGFTPVLKYVLGSVFRPQLLHTRGQTILASTPAEEPDHDFTAIAERAEANGTYTRQTIHDNPRLTAEQIEQFIAEEAKDNGYTVAEYVQTPEFRREYLAERVTDKTLAVMGDDWEGERRTAALVEFSAADRPQFYDAYEALDMGGVDPRAVLFGWWHFTEQRLYIEDEILLRENENTLELAEAIKAKEAELWGASGWDGTLRAVKEERLDDRLAAFLPAPEVERIRKALSAPLQPYLRVSDHNLQQAVDLSTLHGLTFIPTEKSEKRLAIEDLRVGIRRGQVHIHPRCRNLDRHLRTTLWRNARATDYHRRNGEHGDLLDCLVYMWRSVRKSRNPVPHNWGVNPDLQRVRPKPANPLRKIAGLGGRR